MNEQVTTAAVIIALGTFALKELYSIFRDNNKEHVKALAENTLAIAKLTVKLDFLEKRLEELPELRKDLDNLGAKLRSVANGSEMQ